MKEVDWHESTSFISGIIEGYSLVLMLQFITKSMVDTRNIFLGEL